MKYGSKLVELVRDERTRAIYTEGDKKYFYLQHSEEPLQFQVRFKDVDRFGIVLDYLSVNHSEPILDLQVAKDALDRQAERVLEQVTFLLEDFKLIEMDRQNKRAQLRSYPPHNDDNGRYYYEIVLDEGVSAHFQRYAFSRSEKRYEKITSQLTLEVFERLVDEFAAFILEPRG